MSLCEFASVIQRLVILQYQHERGVWQAFFQDAEVKEGKFLGSAFGEGNSPRAAINKYVERIRGEVLVFGAWTDKRVEFKVPSNLEDEV